MPAPSESDDEWGSWPGDSTSAEYFPLLVVVIDTSTIIELKRLLKTDDQWDVFDQMLYLVREGRLAFPVQVYREMARQKHPDTPGVWCGRAVKEVQYPDPAEDTLVEILPAVGQLVDENAEPDNEPADPYVAAMAYELRAAGYDVAVATDDCVDRLPLKIALTTACDALGLPHWDSRTFLGWVRSTVADRQGMP